VDKGSIETASVALHLMYEICKNLKTKKNTIFVRKSVDQK